MSSVSIPITKVNHSSGDALKGCCFVIGPSVIEFYDKNRTVIGALDGDVRLNTDFTLVLKDDPDVIWKLRVTKITIDGTFSEPNLGEKDDDSTGSGSGTFQAQAGGTGLPLPTDSPVAKAKGTV